MAMCCCRCTKKTSGIQKKRKHRCGTGIETEVSKLASRQNILSGAATIRRLCRQKSIMEIVRHRLLSPDAFLQRSESSHVITVSAESRTCAIASRRTFCMRRCSASRTAATRAKLNTWELSESTSDRWSQRSRSRSLSLRSKRSSKYLQALPLRNPFTTAGLCVWTSLSRSWVE